MAARNGRVDDIVNPWESRGDLIARGYSAETATECVAFGVFIRRSRQDGRDPEPADIDYARGRLSGDAYLRQVAPEELDL